MIVRSWTGVTLSPRAEEFIRHLDTTTLPELRTIEGHRGTYVLRRDRETEVEFRVLSLWDSLDGIRQFAGDDVISAVVPEAAQALLHRYDRKVRHYEVVSGPELAR